MGKNFILFFIICSLCYSAGCKSDSGSDEKKSNRKKITFDITGSKAIAAITSGSITGSKIILSLKSFLSEYTGISKADESNTDTLVKITDDDEIKNIIELPDEYTLPPIIQIAVSPVDKSLVIAFQTKIEYDYDDENGESVHVNLGSLIHIKQDNSYTPIIAEDGNLVYNSGLQNKIFDFDNQGNIYFLYGVRNALNFFDASLCKFNTSTKAITEILAPDTKNLNVIWRIDPTGRRLFVNKLDPTEKEFSMYPLNDLAHPVLIFDKNPAVIQGLSYQNSLCGFEFSPDGNTLMAGVSLSTPFLFTGIVKIEIISDSEVVVHPLFRDPMLMASINAGNSGDYYYDPKCNASSFDYFNSVYILMTDGTSFYYYNNGLTSTEYNSNQLYVYANADDAYDQLSSELRTIGTDIWFAMSKSDPSQKSDNGITTLKGYIDTGKTPVFLQLYSSVDINGFYELPANIKQILTSQATFYIWLNNFYINNTYDSVQINSNRILDYFSSFYTGEIEFRWGSKIGDAAIEQAFSESPFSSSIMYGSSGDDPLYFLKSNIFKPGTSENPVMCNELPLMGTEQYNNFFQNANNFYFTANGEVYGILNRYNSTTGKLLPTPARLLDSNGKKDLKIIGQFQTTDYNVEEMFIKNDYIYFKNDESGTGNGPHKLYRFSLTDISLPVEDLLINTIDNGNIVINSFTVGGSSLYFTGTVNSRPVTGSINLQTLEYKSLSADISWSQIEAIE